MGPLPTGSDVTGFLQQVCDEAHARVRAAAVDEPLAELTARARSVAAPPSFSGALSRPGVGVIAEIKRASPSRGVLAAIPDPAGLARGYAAAGAAAVSVLTEPRHFRGDLADLRAVTAGTDVPVLRKDFVVDPYQVWEARAAGAAAVLLIVAALSPDSLTTLLDTVAEAGIDALVEVHDRNEVGTVTSARERATAPPPLILGINARNLSTLEVDAGTFARVRDRAPDGAVLVAESGVAGPDDVRRHAAAGADAVLVGEHLVRAPDPIEAVQRLVAAGAGAEAAGEPPLSRSTHVH